MLISNFRRLRELKSKSKLKNEEAYMLFDEKERAIIDVGAENYDDIFSPFCLYDMNVLDFELEDYLDNKNELIPFEHDLKLVFHIKEANEEKRKEIESTVKQNYEARVHNLNKKVEQNKNHSLIMLFLGIVFLLFRVWFNTFEVPFILVSIFEIASWVFTWSAVDSFFLDRKILQVEKLMTYRLVNSRVEVKDFVPKWALQHQNVQVVENKDILNETNVNGKKFVNANETTISKTPNNNATKV